jgi:hypothetical protein
MQWWSLSTLEYRRVVCYLRFQFLRFEKRKTYFYQNKETLCAAQAESLLIKQGQFLELSSIWRREKNKQ